MSVKIDRFIRFSIVLSIITTVLVFIFLSSLLRCAKERKTDDPVVAQAGDYKISETSFYRALMDKIKWSPVQTQDTPDLRRQTVMDLMTRFHLAQKAVQSRLDCKPEFLKAMQAESTVVILHGLWQQEIGNSLKPEDMSEEELQSAYKKMSMKFHVRHLFARSRHGIDSLYQRLQQKTSFSTLAQSCFRDSTLKRNAGDLGVLTWGDFDDLNLENAVFQLQVGQYSKPVESKYGWHILYLENLIYNPLLTEQDYLVKKKSIQTRIWHRRLKQLSDERVRALMDAKHIRMNVPLILELEKAQRRLNNNGLVSFNDITEVADSPLENLLDSRRDAVVALYDGGQWTVADMRRYLATVSPEALHSGLYRTAAMSLRNYFLLQMAQQKHIDRVPAVRSEIEDKRRHLLSASYLAAYADTCSFREDDFQQYYDQHRMQFLSDREMTILEIRLASEVEAYRIRSLINTESDFRKCARQFTLRPGYREKEGLLGVIKKGDFGAIGAAAFKMKPGAERGPVVRVENGYSLIMVVNAKDIYIPFSSAKPEIQKIMQQQAKSWAWQKLQAECVARQKINYNAILFDRNPAE